jgi:hypothetical protein
MGGTLHGSLDHVTTGPGNAGRNQEMFTWLYNFFTNQVIGNGYGTLIASNYGNNGGAGTGFDYYDGANPSLDNAFFVVRMNVSTVRPGGGSQLGAYYILVQWAETQLFGAAPGNPGKISNSTGDGVGMVAAFREDGTSPWAGTTNADGTDTKGATVWTPGTSTVHVLERSDSPGGGNAANKENMIRVSDGTAITRMHMLCDEDNIIILRDLNNNGEYFLFAIGTYEPSANLTINYPMVFIATGLPLAVASVYGTLIGSGANEGTLVSSDFSGIEDCIFVVDWETENVTIMEAQPNPQADPSAYDEQNILLITEDADVGNNGLCGVAHLMKVAYGAPTDSANFDMDRISFGTNDINNNNLTVPWDPTALPRATNSRAGRQF